ncbi:nitrogen regulatory protein P-II [Spirochaetia bacterium]|nr:nitrogen regulatory protein P-II [Spirochaetia bacterium]
MVATELKQPVLRLLFVIIDWDKTKAVSQVFAQEHVRFHFVVKGEGTANSEILNLLGIGASDKAVVLCIERQVMMPILVRAIHRKLGHRSAGAGIAFTVPLSSMSTMALQVFNKSINKKRFYGTRRGEKMAEDKQPVSPITNDLIVAIIKQGHSDAFMATARESGARGGTILNARALSNRGVVKVFGASVQEEREIILIVTSRKQKTAIMQALSQKHGIASEASGVIFSCPVDAITSLNQEMA